jgi:hypothetical protein
MVLKDKNLQKELEQNGFVVIPFLNVEEVLELNEIYKDLHPNGTPPEFFDNIHMTTWCSDLAYKKNVCEKLELFFKQPNNSVFSNFRSLNNVFIVKKNGQNTTFNVHQDWNVVDETKYQSVNVWVPLHAVDENSGALWVLKGSHQIGRKIRGAGYLFPNYSEFKTQLQLSATSVKLKAGEAIIFYHSVIHGSPPNLSSDYRKVACFSILPEQAPLCIYFQANANSMLEKHEPKDDFIYKYDNLRLQTLESGSTEKPVEVFPPYTNKKVDITELNNVLNF